MGSLLASTAPQSKTGTKHENKRYESTNKFLLILDDNEEEFNEVEDVGDELVNQKDKLSDLSQIEPSR